MPKCSQPKHIDSDQKLSKLPQADLDALSVLKEKHDFIRFLDPTDYLGFDVFNEEADEPIADKPPWRKSE